MSRHRSVVGIACFESRHEAGRLLAHVLDEAEVVPVLSLLNREATKQLRCKWELTVVPGASHLFEEVGALEGVAELAAAWFTNHLPLPRARSGSKSDDRSGENPWAPVSAWGELPSNLDFGSSP